MAEVVVADVVVADVVVEVVALEVDVDVVLDWDVFVFAW